MKKRVIAVAIVMALGVFLAGCSSESASTQEEISVVIAEEDEITADEETGSAESENTETGTDSSSESQITEDEALAIALADSGLSEDSLTGTRVKTETQQGSLLYEVDLYAEAEAYEYEIDASDGEILDKDYDYEEAYSSTVTVPSGVISRDEAAALVLERVDGATQWDLRIGLDTDDGQYVWEGDLYYDGVEYEFEISGSSGTFLEWER